MRIRLTLALLLALGIGSGVGLSTITHAQTGAGGFNSVEEQIAAAMADLEQKRARKGRVDSEIQGLADRRGAAQSRLRSRTRALYRISRAGMLPLAGGFPALLAHISRVDRLERMVVNDARGLSSLEARGQALRDETAELASSLVETEQRLAELESQRARLEEVTARTDFWDRGFAAETPMQGGGWGSIRVLDAPMGNAPSFTSVRGRLGMPVAGRVDIRPAERGDGPGVEVFASHGAAVRASEQGRVAYTAHQAGYGPMVILDHGDSYFTVYGGLDRTSVQVGQTVPRGAQLGVIGADAVFFQVRRGSRALDASAWLGL